MNGPDNSWREEIARAREQLAADNDALSTDRANQDAVEDLVHRRGDKEKPPQIFPGYQVVRELHRGGQGIVYLAIESETERKVAVKVLLAGPLASDSALKRFEREVKLAARLNHPNIITILHTGQTTDGQPFYVMDYVRGVSFDEYVRTAKIDMRETLRLFATVCHAVSHAHQKGVIHRDLKPSNILVTADGQPKVLDFGLAKQLAGPDALAQTATGAPLGTIAFMSPEQVRGNPDEIDTRADVYALGVILYVAMTGTFPYPVHRGIAEVFKHITDSSPRRPSRVWTSDAGVQAARLASNSCPLDKEVESIILKSIEKEVDRRYPIAGELGRDIERYLAGEPIQAQGDSLVYRLKKSVMRHRLAAAVLLGYVTLVTVGLVGALWSLRAVQVARKEEYRQRRTAEIQQSVLEEKNIATIREFDGIVSSVEEELQRQELSDHAKLRISKKLGDAHRALSWYDRAESFYRIAEDAADDAAESKEKLKLQYDLAAVFLESGQHEEAEALLRTIDSPQARSSLALALKYQEKFEEAESIYLEMLEEFAAKPLSKATILHNLGGLEYDRKNYRKAIEFIERCLEIRMEKWKAAEGPSKAALERSILIAKNNLGGNYMFLGDFDQADSILSEVVATGRAILPEGHDLLGHFLFHEGRLRVRTKEYDRAEVTLLEAYRINQSHFGADNRWTREVAEWLIELYTVTGKPELAKAFFRSDSAAMPAAL